jgi:hypothetical protein
MKKHLRAGLLILASFALTVPILPAQADDWGFAPGILGGKPANWDGSWDAKKTAAQGSSGGEWSNTKEQSWDTWKAQHSNTTADGQTIYATPQVGPQGGIGSGEGGFQTARTQGGSPITQAHLPLAGAVSTLGLANANYTSVTPAGLGGTRGIGGSFGGRKTGCHTDGFPDPLNLTPFSSITGASGMGWAPDGFLSLPPTGTGSLIGTDGDFKLDTCGNGYDDDGDEPGPSGPPGGRQIPIQPGGG